MTSPSSATDTVGEAFADALSRKQFDQVAALLHDDVDFRALTPRRSWQASSSDQVVDEVLTTWFEPSDEIERLVSVETGSVGDRQRVAYRFEGRNPDGPFVLEQQAYYTEQGGRIAWMRVLCSGFRPRPDTGA